MMGTKFEYYYDIKKTMEFADFRSKVINYKELSDKFRVRVVDAIEVGLVNGNNYH